MRVSLISSETAPKALSVGMFHISRAPDARTVPYGSGLWKQEAQRASQRAAQRASRAAHGINPRPCVNIPSFLFKLHHLSPASDSTESGIQIFIINTY